MKKFLVVLLAMLMALSCLSFAVAEEEPVEIELFLEMPIEFDPATCPIIPKLEEACNVKLSFRLATQTAVGEQRNLLVTSGNYPDIIQFSGVDSAFIDSVNNNILVAIDDYIEDYPNLIAHVAPSSYVALKSSVPDGKLYGVARNSVMRTDGWLVRCDWLDACGIEMDDCATLSKDEFHDLLYAFTYGDPDGNGVDDTYGLATGSVNALFTGAFGDLGWQKAEEGSEFEYMSAKFDKNSTAYVDALEYTRQLWVEGLIDPNDITNSGNAFRDRFYDGSVGVVRMFGGWLNSYEDALHDNFPGVETKYIVGIENDDGECVGVSSLGGNLYGFYSITTTGADKVEACLGLLDYMVSDEGWELMCDGVEGWTYTIVDGEKVATQAFADEFGYRNYLGLLRRYDDPGYFVLLNNTSYERSWKYIQAACDITIETCDMGFKPAAQQTTAYKDYATEAGIVLNDILIGKREAEEWYDVLDKWYADGGLSDYVAEMNDFIASLN